MSDIWILVADSSAAQVYATRHPRAAPTLVHSLDHMQSRLRPRERGTDQPGRVHDRFGPARHSLDTAQQAKSEERHRFAREISDYLAEAQRRKQFRQLVVMAGPAFLGVLREVFGKTLGQAIIAEVPKDLVGQDAAAIQAHMP
ncbi:MAG: host attachment protein [Gammaproteobacteria bacterium]|nr:host attachment protein [Gammaproteobacteria bacterium]